MKMAGIFLVIVAVITGGFYWYYVDSQRTIAVLTKNNAQLETAITLSEEAVESLQQDYALVQEENRLLNSDFASIRRENNALAEKLQDNDVGALAANKPELIEQLINNGSKNTFRCFEILSGAPLTDTERTANDAATFNSECPWLWPRSPSRMR